MLRCELSLFPYCIYIYPVLVIPFSLHCVVDGSRVR